jgi:hypothetical protein
MSLVLIEHRHDRPTLNSNRWGHQALLEKLAVAFAGSSIDAVAQLPVATDTQPVGDASEKKVVRSEALSGHPEWAVFIEDDNSAHDATTDRV